jgi:hypothetical protein
MIDLCAKLRTLLLALALSASAACGDDDDDDAMTASGRGGGGGKGAGAGTSAPANKDAGSSQDNFDPQLPPSETKQVEAWLARGFYKDWLCEDEPTAKTFGAPAIHAHGGKSFVCNNDLLAETEREDGEEYPQGIASVKEILNSSGNVTLTAVSVKIAAKSDGGKGWYWYEGASHSGIGIAECTGCHSAAGSDADHPGPGDFVYFRN